jgi:hypothetical protein
MQKDNNSMEIERIYFPTSLEDHQVVEQGNLDVFVTMKDGYTYNLTVGTLENIQYLMDKEKKNFLEPCFPFIIVKCLSKAIIEETIIAYATEVGGYFIKLYHFMNHMDDGVFTQLQTEHLRHREEVKRLGDLETLEALQKLAKLYESNDSDNQ